MLRNIPARSYITCASCGRMAHTTTNRNRLLCQWCKKGPLCMNCRIPPRGRLTSCDACVEAMPLSRMVDVFPCDIEPVHPVAARGLASEHSSEPGSGPQSRNFD